MGWVEEAGLYALHVFYVLWQAFVALFSSVKATLPQPLDAQRKKLPVHLALTFTDTEGVDQKDQEEAVVQSIYEAAWCCSKAGIHNLSVYDRSGLSISCAELVSSRIPEAVRSLSSELDSSSESDLEYPLTPPASDSLNSRPLSPQESFRDAPNVTTMYFREHSTKLRRKSKDQKPLVKRRHSTVETAESDQRPNEVKLTIFSYDSSKPAMALVARNLARQRLSLGKPWEEKTMNPVAFVDAIDSTLSDITRLSTPELMLVHSLTPNRLKTPALELEGFPPWIMRLTEFYHDCGAELRWIDMSERSSPNKPAVLTEVTFRHAIDEFASAEMRMGK